MLPRTVGRVALAAAGALLTFVTTACSRAEPTERPESVHGIPVLSVETAVDQEIRTPRVLMEPIASDYVPAVDINEAADLAFAQLGPAARPTGVRIYLGMGVEHVPTWVFLWEGVCGAVSVTMGGDGRDRSCELAPNTSIDIDAESGVYLGGS